MGSKDVKDGGMLEVRLLKERHSIGTLVKSCLLFININMRKQFNNLYKQVIKEANVKSDIYIDPTKNGPQMSIKRSHAKEKKALDVTNLAKYVNKLGEIEKMDQLSNPFHCQFEFSNGNIKVGGDTIIVNMGSASTCPSAMVNLCELFAKGLCYAFNAETGIHKDVVLASKSRQEIQWKRLSAKEIAYSLVAIITELRKKGEIKYVRMNESGDFGSVEDVKKLKEIIITVNAILDKPVIFYNYTHRSDLFPANKNPLDKLPNFVLQGSGWRKDLEAKPDQFEKGVHGRTVRPELLKAGKKIAFMVDNCFYALDYSEFKKAKFGSQEESESVLPVGVKREQIVQCPGSCKFCDQCKTGGKKFIVIVIHGRGAEAQSIVGQMGRTLGNRARANKAITSNGTPFEDKEIVDMYTAIGRNDYDFLEKLHSYYLNPYIKKEKKFQYPFNISHNDIINVWNRLIALRKKAVDTKDFQAKQWILPNKVGKSELKEPVEAFLSTLKKKKEPVQEAVDIGKKKQIDLTTLNPIQLSNLAVTNQLPDHKQFVSPELVEDEMEGQGNSVV